MRRAILFAVFTGVLMAAAPALAQDDVENSKDHPMVSRFPGYYIADYDDQEFGAFEFTVAEEKQQQVEGHYWKIEYYLKDGARKGGPIQIARNYAGAITGRGGVKLYESVDVNGGTISARLPVGGKNVWLQVQINNAGEIYTLYVVEEAGMEQKVEFSAMDLAKTLDAKGSVALHGILFDTGKATIKPESAAAIAPIGELLKSTPALKLEIQGHTDNAGTPGVNLRLSQERAAAVKAYLVTTFGIAADRLTTAGFGDTKPVADNKTDDNRAQNRRVELVKK